MSEFSDPAITGSDSMVEFQSEILTTTLSAVRQKRRRRVAWRVAGVAMVAAMIIHWFPKSQLQHANPAVSLAEVETGGEIEIEKPPLITRTLTDPGNRAALTTAQSDEGLISITRTTSFSSRITRSSDRELFAFLEGYRYIMMSRGEGGEHASLRLLD